MTSEEFFQLLGEGDQSAVSHAVMDDPSLANARAADGASAVQWLVYRGRRDLADILLAAGAQVDLTTACTVGKAEAVSGDVNALSADGFRPLALAVAFGHNDLARLLLERGADPNLRSIALGGVAPIHAAVFGRSLEAAKLLVEAGADVDAAQVGGFTALMGAAQNGDLAMLNYLLAQGADLAIKDQSGKNAEDWAANDIIITALNLRFAKSSYGRPG